MAPLDPGARSPASRPSPAVTVRCVLELLFPPSCVRCGEPSTPLCRRCAALLVAAEPRDPPEGLAALWSLVDYDDAGRSLVTSLKYDGRRDAVRVLGAALADLPDRGVDVVTWAPTSPSRRRARGFDQARLLAVATARATRTPHRRLLVRPEGPSQTGHDRADRLQGPAFDPRGRVPPRVLVVDDVVTTGATLSAAASALRRAGAAEVLGLTLASVR